MKLKKIIFCVLVLFSLCIPSLVGAIASSSDQLAVLGMATPLARYIGDKLIKTDTSGNLVLPVASAKKLSVTVAGTEKAAVSSAGVLSSVQLNFGSSYETVAGAGTNQGTAAALSASKQVHQITGANATVGWILATPAAGDIHVFLNTTAGVANIYPQSGGTINGGAANAVFAALTGIKPIICFASSTSAWLCA